MNERTTNKITAAQPGENLVAISTKKFKRMMPTRVARSSHQMDILFGIGEQNQDMETTHSPAA
jgi:hypothetical protein